MTIEGRDNRAGKRLKLGMVGGGQGAFIGAVHRIASRIDGEFELVAGALSSDPARARASAEDLGLDPARSYGSYAEMLAEEAKRPDRIDAVVIVTPNHMHHPVAKAALEAGFHVICDKPLTTTSAQSEELVQLAEKTGLVFCVTHNYTGYPMVRQARAMVAAGVLGDIRLVQAEYPQGWLTDPIEQTGQKQAEWRTDPARSGAGGCIGDIGTHAFNLACFISGQVPEKLLAELTTFVPGRRVDDNVTVLMRYANGAKGTIWTSQVAPGNENNLKIRIFGTKGGLEWEQTDPNYLWVTPHGGQRTLYTRGGDGAWPEAARVTRIPGGHPEGYLEGFATIYAEAARAIRAHRAGQPVAPEVIYPTAKDGLTGVRFIERSIASSAAGNVWVDF